VVQESRLVFVEVLEHDGELFESGFGHTSQLFRFDLLFQVLLHPHVQLVQLIPLLCQTNCTVFRVLVVEDQSLLHLSTDIFNLRKFLTFRIDSFRMFLQTFQLFFKCTSITANHR